MQLPSFFVAGGCAKGSLQGSFQCLQVSFDGEGTYRIASNITSILRAFLRRTLERAAACAFFPTMSVSSQEVG
jgi:hypothetical protein